MCHLISVLLFSTLALISAKYQNSKESAIEGRQIEFVPNVVFKTGLSVRRRKWRAAYQFSYTAKQYTDATNAKFTDNAIDGIVPAYQIMDLSGEYYLNRHFMLSANINNLANAHYFTRRADSYPGPGIVPADARSFYVTLQCKL